MLRDITRNISNGISDKIQGLNVVVIDERGEISSTYRGIMQNDLGSVQDSKAKKYAMCCGVKGIFTAHGNSIEDVMKNPELKELIQEKIFEKVIVIKARNDSNYEFETINL